MFTKETKDLWRHYDVIIRETKVEKVRKSNAKAFWSHTRRKLKTKCSVAPLLEDVKNKSSLKFKDKEKANILQKVQYLQLIKEQIPFYKTSAKL